MLRLNLFGAGRAYYGDHSLPGFPNQQPCLLLCYLVLDRHHPHTREYLAAVFWGDYPTSVSRKYLRNALWRLRHILQSIGAPVEEYLLVDDETIRFVRSEHCWLDIEVFETAVARCQQLSGQEFTLDQAACLENAMDLYVDDLLRGLYEDWCLHERERLHLLYLSALSKLMDFCERQGTYERGLAYGERILACDNTREKVHRQMMRLYCLLGDRTAALAQYKRCDQILHDALDIAPMPETQSLYQQIAHDRFLPEAFLPFDASLPPAGYPKESAQQLVAQAMQSLKRLEERVEETHTELHRISALIHTALLSASEPDILPH
jgi:DNA-binding SARP family transcriptional activator